MVLNFILLDVARPRYTAELIPWGYGPSVMYRRTFVFCIIVPQTATLLTERYAWGAIPSMPLEIILIPYMWLTPYVIDTQKCLYMPAIQGHTRNYIFQCHKGNLLGSDWECLFWYGDKIVFWNPTSPVPFHFLLLVALISRSEQPCNLFFQSRIELCSIKLFALWNTPRPELYIIASFILIPKHPELFLRP